jgi:hypothetical protein
MPTTHRAAIISAIIYAGVSLGAATTFLLVTMLTGEYGWVARMGGAVWVFVLSMIILMPVVIPRVKRRIAG